MKYIFLLWQQTTEGSHRPFIFYPNHYMVVIQLIAKRDAKLNNMIYTDEQATQNDLLSIADNEIFFNIIWTNEIWLKTRFLKCLILILIQRFSIVNGQSFPFVYNWLKILYKERSFQKSSLFILYLLSPLFIGEDLHIHSWLLVIHMIT